MRQLTLIQGPCSVGCRVSRASSVPPRAHPKAPRPCGTPAAITPRRAYSGERGRTLIRAIVVRGHGRHSLRLSLVGLDPDPRLGSEMRQLALIQGPRSVGCRVSRASSVPPRAHPKAPRPCGTPAAITPRLAYSGERGRSLIRAIVVRGHGTPLAPSFPGRPGSRPKARERDAAANLDPRAALGRLPRLASEQRAAPSPSQGSTPVRHASRDHAPARLLWRARQDLDSGDSRSGDTDATRSVFPWSAWIRTQGSGARCGS